MGPPMEGPLWVVGSTGLVLKTVTWDDSRARMLFTERVAAESVEDGQDCPRQRSIFRGQDQNSK